MLNLRIVNCIETESIILLQKFGKHVYILLRTIKISFEFLKNPQTHLDINPLVKNEDALHWKIF